MATLEQIGTALKKAAAAGDTNAATTLARAYKSMQTQAKPVDDSAPSGPPGSREYADWAARQARAGKALPMIEGSGTPTNQQSYDAALEGVRQADFADQAPAAFAEKAKSALPALNPQEIAQNDQLFGFGDELAGVAGGIGQAVRGKDFGASYDAWQKLQEARRNLGIEQGGIPAQAGSIVGQLTSLGASAPASVAVKAASRIPQVIKDIASSTTTGGIMGGVQGFGSTDGNFNQRLEGAKQGAIAGASVGAVAPVAIRAVAAPFERAAQTAAVNAAIKNAPDASDLSSVASQMFKSSKSSGVGVAPQRFGTVAKQLADDAIAKDIDKDLDGPAWTVYERVIQLAKDGFADPANLSLSKLHNLRQKAQDVAFDPASKNRTKQFAQDVVDGIDNMWSTLKPSDITGPTNLIGNGKDAANTLLDAISTWAKAKKVGLIESAMGSAENYLAGKESGLRSQFKTLLNSPKTKNLWNTTERKALQDVINGTLPVRALRTLGIFRGFAAAGVGGGLGSVFGPLGSAAGTALGGAAGLAARQFTENAASGAAQRAAKIVATPNVPVFNPAARRIPSTLLPLLPSRQRQ